MKGKQAGIEAENVGGEENRKRKKEKENQLNNSFFSSLDCVFFLCFLTELLKPVFDPQMCHLHLNTVIYFALTKRRLVRGEGNNFSA